MRTRRWGIFLAVVMVSSACAEAGGRRQAVPVPLARERAPAAEYPAEPDGSALMRFANEEGDLFACYTRFLRTTDKKGTTVLQFSILQDGRVEGAQILESSIDDEETTACVVDLVSRWQTPFRPSARKIFRIPFTIE